MDKMLLHLLIVSNRSKKNDITAGGIRRADYATPLY
jgi:hypothetical protein